MTTILMGEDCCDVLRSSTVRLNFGYHSFSDSANLADELPGFVTERGKPQMDSTAVRYLIFMPRPANQLLLLCKTHHLGWRCE